MTYVYLLIETQIMRKSERNITLRVTITELEQELELLDEDDPSSFEEGF